MLLVNQSKPLDAKDVNTVFLSLKKQLAENEKKIANVENKLKNIKIGGGGGDIDAYTKQESDDRFAPINHNHNSLYYGKNEVDTKLSGKANTSHTHAISDVTNLQTTLNSKANSSHTHAISDVTNLQTTLNGKQSTLVSGSNIKTVNGNSILGSGNITISGATPVLSTDYTLPSGVTFIKGGIYKTGNIVTINLQVIVTSSSFILSLGTSLRPKGTIEQYGGVSGSNNSGYWQFNTASGVVKNERILVYTYNTGSYYIYGSYNLDM